MKSRIGITTAALMLAASSWAQSIPAGNDETTITTVSSPLQAPVAAPEPAPAAVQSPVEDESMDIVSVESELAGQGDLQAGLISLNIKGAELGNVIRLFTELSGANIIVPEMQDLGGAKKIDISLKNVEWKPALQAILEGQGLELYETIPGAEVYVVRTRAPTEGVPQNMQTIVLKHAAVKDTTVAIQGFLGANGTVQPYESGNAIVVKTSAPLLADVNRIIQKIDVPRRQILIEAKILELSHSGNDETGVNFSFDNIIRGHADADNPFKGNLDLVAREIPTALANAPVGGLLTLDAADVTVALKALQSKGNVKLVSSPKVIVENGKEAKINILEKIPKLSRSYTPPTFSEPTILNPTGRELTPGIITVAQEGDGEDPDTKRKRYVEYEFGIRLSVTPTIYTEDNIAVDINPIITRENTDKSIQMYLANDAGGEPIYDTFYAIDEKRVNTTFMLASGQTAVIGGLTTTRDSEEETRVPLLSDIPLIRHLFIYRKAVKTQVEDVIFVTVTLEEGKEFDIAKAVKTSPLTRKQLIREQGDQIVQDKEVELFEARDVGRVKEDIKEVKRIDQIEGREQTVRKPFWYFLRPDVSPRWSPL